MIIYVGKKVIESGIRSDSRVCPIALAIQRKLPGFQVAVGCSIGDVNVFNVMIWREGMVNRFITLPPKVQQFIRDFDASREVKPFYFSLAL